MNGLTPLTEGVGIALDSIRANKVRAALTILGIAIGVMVVMVIASMINGINRSVSSMLESMGPKTFIVFRYFQSGPHISDGSDERSPWRKMPPLTVQEARRIAGLPSISFVAYGEFSGGPVKFEDQELVSISIGGLSADWPKVVGGDVFPGRSFSAIEEASGAQVGVVTQKLATQLFGPRDPIGQQIKVSGLTYTVVGVWAPPSGLFGDEGSRQIIIPHTTFTKHIDHQKGWMQFRTAPKEGFTVQQAIEDVTAAMRAMRGLKPSADNNFSVVTQDKLLQSFQQVTGAFFLVMIALSSVGLLVGGVGVVAIMMISVTERTREIGVRKALGARRREILWQFLVEAATLTLVGGAVGMVIGGAVAFAVAKWSPIPAAVPLWAIVAALGASAVTGVGFGLYPAARAARLDPVEALRYE
ncbi:MAG: ABC transporter permease [Gemmatimonadetes bacterium]|nr:ABC transporter permease [Gemmatimonadota bacterium]